MQRHRVTRAMQAGTDRHAELEAMLGEAVVVPVSSAEDMLAVKLLRTYACLQQLLEGCLTRELYICGNLQVRSYIGHWRLFIRSSNHIQTRHTGPLVHRRY